MPGSKGEKEAAENIQLSLDRLRVSYTTDGNHSVKAYLSLRGKEWAKELETFMQSNYAGESADFLNAVRGLLDGKKLQQKITKLVDTYIRESGEQQVNIDSSIRNEIIKKCEAKQQEKEGSFNLSDFHLSLVKAVDQITRMIEMDVGVRCVASAKMASYVEAEKSQFKELEEKLTQLKAELRALESNAAPEIKKMLGIDISPKLRELLGIEQRLSQLKTKVTAFDNQFTLTPKMHEDEFKVLRKEATDLTTELQQASIRAKKSQPTVSLKFTAAPSTPTVVRGGGSSEEPSPDSTPKTPSPKSAK